MKSNISKTPVVIKLIGVTVFIYFLQHQLGRTFVDTFALKPVDFIYGKKLWQVVSYMFLHAPLGSGAGIFHIFSNMYALFLFGLPIEQVWGSRTFLKYYFFCGIGGGLAFVLVSYLTDSMAIQVAGGYIPILTYGASGATFGLLAAFGLMFPNVKLYLLFFPMGIKAKYLVILYAAFEVYAEVGKMQVGVNHIAHLGGLVSGLIFFALFIRGRKVVLLNKFDAKISNAREKQVQENKIEIDNARKKHIIKKLEQDPDINHLSDDEYQYIKYLDIMNDDDINMNNLNYDINNLSDKEFIQLVRKYIEVD